MGRITIPVTIENGIDSAYHLAFDAMVDTGASHLTLPTAWKEKLGPFSLEEPATLEMGDQSQLTGQVCGPVKIQIEGFRPIMSEVLFVEMSPIDGNYEPLLGYIPLEQCQAAVDMRSHRLVKVRALDLK